MQWIKYFPLKYLSEIISLLANEILDILSDNLIHLIALIYEEKEKSFSFVKCAVQLEYIWYLDKYGHN